MSKQHKYGQHYTPIELTKRYIDIFNDVKSKNLTVVDPFVGEGNLLIDYLNTFPKEDALNLLHNKKIKGFDIDLTTLVKLKSRFKEYYGLPDDLLDEIFIENNSLINNLCDNNDFILTNPPYLARNTCKRKYKEDFEIHFSNNNFNDYYEIALDQYFLNDGIWIIPSNFISSNSMSKIRKNIISKKNISSINLFEIPIFDNTDISVVSFLLSDTLSIQKKLDISFIQYEKNIFKEIDINEDGFICSDWEALISFNTQYIQQGLLREELKNGNNECYVLNESYDKEKIFINDETFNKISNNYLFLRTTDTGTNSGILGLYTLKELFPKSFNGDECPITLLTKISSRLYTPIFFKECISYEEQIIIKDKVNLYLKEYRDKYNSIFLTNFKNATKSMSRKRISFKEVYGLIEKAIDREL